jgi:E3 ubiquitin-protein ligase TRIP12
MAMAPARATETETKKTTMTTTTTMTRVSAAAAAQWAMAALFGAEFRQFGSYMLGMSARLKALLGSISMSADPTTRLLALQELAEILSMSTEDTLASFPMDAYVRALVRVLGGAGAGDGDDDAPAQEDEEMDEDAQLAAALAMSSGPAGDENPEAQVLACRCLANLMEALPGCAHTIVYHGAIPILCSKLVEISYIDLAEQTLSVRILAHTAVS